MGRFVKGDVVVLPFPFSDLTTAKKRPAVVVASLTGDDVLERDFSRYALIAGGTPAVPVIRLSQTCAISHAARTKSNPPPPGQ